MSFLDAILNKGGAGRSLSRHESAERLNPVLRRHVELNLAYDDATRRIGSVDVTRQMEHFQKKARADVGKLRETIYSMGNVAYTGTDLEPDDVRLGEDDDAMLFALLDREQALLDAVEAELNLKRPNRHHIRTMAILNHVLTNSQERLTYLKGVTRDRRRPATA